MSILVTDWSDDEIKQLNLSEHKSDQSYCVYVMHSRNKEGFIIHNQERIPTSRVYRIGGIGVHRIPGAATGNTPAGRLAQCSRIIMDKETGLRSTIGFRPARPWEYVFGITITGNKNDDASGRLKYITAFLESWLQYQFCKKYHYMGKSHFKCANKGTVQEFAINLFLSKNISPLFSKL